MRVRRLLADDVSLITTIDRSEHVDVQYRVIDGRLTEQPVAMSEIPTWDPTGSGPHSVAAQIATPPTSSPRSSLAPRVEPTIRSSGAGTAQRASS